MAVTETKGYFVSLQEPLRVAMPEKRKVVVMSCPVDDCNSKDITWHCFVCENNLEYGLDEGFFYCECGSRKPSNGLFKCLNHRPKNATDDSLKVSCFFINQLI